jgi:hypothetical protein
MTHVLPQAHALNNNTGASSFSAKDGKKFSFLSPPYLFLSPQYRGDSDVA